MEATEVLAAWGAYVTGAHGLWYAVDWAWWKYLDWYLEKAGRDVNCTRETAAKDVFGPPFSKLP